MPKLSLNLVTWNGIKYLPYSLKSIEEQTFKDFEVLIIDNGSIDGTPLWISKNYPEFKLVRNAKNLGFAGAHNQGIYWTSSEYVFAMNQDIVLEPDFLEVLVDFLDAHKDAGAVTGKLLKWDFSKEPVFEERIKDKLNLTGKINLIDSLGLKIFKSQRVVELGAEEEDSGYNKEIEVFGVSGAAPLYRRRALLESAIPQGSGIEYFDSDFFSFKEDADLAYRMKLLGFKAYLIPKVCAYHDRTAAKFTDSVTLNRKRKSPFVNYHSYKNHLFFLEKNLTPWIFIRYFPWIFFYEFKKFIYILLFEQETSKALFEFLKKFVNMWRKRKWIMKRRRVKNKEIVKWLS